MSERKKNKIIFVNEQFTYLVFVVRRPEVIFSAVSDVRHMVPGWPGVCLRLPETYIVYTSHTAWVGGGGGQVEISTLATG